MARKALLVLHEAFVRVVTKNLAIAAGWPLPAPKPYRQRSRSIRNRCHRVFGRPAWCARQIKIRPRIACRRACVQTRSYGNAAAPQCIRWQTIC